MSLRPSEIYYSQNSIGCSFTSGEKIGETLDDLCEGRISVHDIPMICVFKVNGKWVTMDNRRLWVFRHLERLGKCNKVPVLQRDTVPYFRMTSDCAGTEVQVRGDPGGQWYQRSSSSFLITLGTVAGVVGIGALALFALEKK